MSVDKDYERPTYNLFSLFKLSCVALGPGQYISLNENVRKALNVDVHFCCRSLIKIIKNNEVEGTFNPLGDRRHMYDKVRRGGVLNVRITLSALKFGHIDCLKVAHEMGFPLYMTVGEVRSIPGVFSEIRKYMLHVEWKPQILDSMICSSAAYYGTLPCLQYANQLGFPWDVSSCVAAVKGGNIDCLKYLVEKGCPLDGPQPSDVAAFDGNLIALKYLHEHGCPWSVDTCSHAASGGHLDCLKYLHANGCPWDVSTTTRAVRCGKLPCFKFAMEQGCPIDASVINVAALLGYLPILKFLHEQGFPWSAVTSSNAATTGHLDCLIYARANGCPWDSSTCISAVSNAYVLCRQFQEEHGRPWNEKTCIDAMNSHPQAAECLNYVWRNGCPWRNGTCLAGSGDGRMDCLLSQPDHHCKWSSEEFTNYKSLLRRGKSITSGQIAYLLFRCI